MALKSQQELYDLFISELQSLRPDLTDTNDGSVIDIVAGVTATAVDEIQKVSQDEFRKTFLDTANGPEVTGSADDLQTLAVDHFGDDFARPAAVKATGVVTFSRANTNAGNVSILAGTVLKTPSSATGTSLRFEVVNEVTLTGLSINASVRALEAGVSGNVLANTITQIETTLTDSSVVVNNASALSGGENAETDAEYRETIRLLLTKIRGGTKEAIEAAALTVGGVETAIAIEIEKPVIEYDIATDAIASGAEFFRIPYVNIYIADANGSASQLLIDSVLDEVKKVRSFGVYVTVSAATAVAFNWTTQITLNVAGPNYAVLSVDPQKIIDSMTQYVNELGIGDDFIRTTAEAAIMAIWGPTGTNDLTAFTTLSPSGDVSTATGEKLIAGTMGIA